MNKKLQPLLAFLLLCLPVQAATYYVSKTANGAHASDGTNCSTTDSNATNKLTIRLGISCLASGDTLQIHTGTYAEKLDNFSMTIASGTSFSNPTTVKAFSGEIVTIRPSVSAAANILDLSKNVTTNYTIWDHIIFDGTNVNGPHSAAFAIYCGASFNRFTNVEVKNVTGGTGIGVTGNNNEFISCIVHNGGANRFDHGFYVSGGGKNNLIKACTIYSNSGYGVTVYDSVTGMNGNIVRECLIHDNGTTNDGTVGDIGMSQGDSCQIINNVVYRGSSPNSSYIGIDASGTNIKVYNNTSYGHTWYGITTNSATSATVQNNIAFGNAPNLDLVHSGTTQDHNLSTDPTFADVTGGDFHILAGSAARDTGTTISLVATDFDGFTRPQGAAYDIGAYEFIVNIPPPISTIAVTFPNGGESIVVGTDVNITWTTNGTDNVKIEASRDGGATYPAGELICSSCAQVVGSTNVRAWTPTAPRTSAFRVKITNLIDGAVDSSDADATVHGFYVK